ncbi:hypothetical protein [Algoriphagus resistens]|uniref:hypothetical protein n=1 Tax=Algoriphagus resistens TaxID=1750590 RepID=UPI000716A2CD|nr:hypothetical protein [Algoriphagus resistens]
MKNLLNRNTGDLQGNEDFWFPGRYVGGLSMVLAPLLVLTGLLLRMKYNFFFPQQLQAYQEHPLLIKTAYSFFVVGNILLWPGILTLVRLIGQKKRRLAIWGGTFVVLGLFARTFHGGVDHMAFLLVDTQGLESATKTVADSYGAFSIVATLNSTIMFGWLILAVGSYLSEALGLLQSIALGLMSALMLGVLKGTSLVSIIAVTGLCIALMPLGFKVLRNGAAPKLKDIIIGTLIIVCLTVLLYFLGQAG